VSDEDTRAALDAALRAHAEPHVDDGEVITRWVAIAATQRFDGGGVVIMMVDDEAVPRWQVRGVLKEAYSVVDNDGQDDQPGDE
jgi:hypothetical protein